MTSYAWNCHAWYFVHVRILKNFHDYQCLQKQSKTKYKKGLKIQLNFFANDDMLIEVGKSYSTHSFNYGLVWLCMTFTCSNVWIQNWCAHRPVDITSHLWQNWGSVANKTTSVDMGSLVVANPDVPASYWCTEKNLPCNTNICSNLK